MISRREVVTAGMLGTLATASPAVLSEIQSDVQALKEGFKNLDDSLDSLKSSVDQGLRGNSMNFGNVGQVKEAIRKWATTGGRFPEFCDIGIDVFYDVYDWHIRNRQPLVVLRQADNRYTIQFMFTTLILRYEYQVDFVGNPYDKA